MDSMRPRSVGWSAHPSAKTLGNSTISGLARRAIRDFAPNPGELSIAASGRLPARGPRLAIRVCAQALDLLRAQRARAAGRERAELDRPHAHAHESHDRMPERVEGAPDLALAALMEHQREGRTVGVAIEARDTDACRRR